MLDSLPDGIREKMAGSPAGRTGFLWEICLHHLKKLLLKVRMVFDSFLYHTSSV